MSDNLDILIAMGFEFNPTAKKLINGYLIPWVMGQNPLWNGVVEKAIYGDSFPWEIFSDIESHWHSKMEEKGAVKYTIFAFTTLLRAQNSKRVCRRAGRGTWGGQTGPKKIEDPDTRCIIGQSKMLAFEHSGEADVGHWTMHEYSLSEELVKMSGRSNAADLVVCKITKTIKKKEKSDHNTNQSPAGIGHGDRYDALAAQSESYGNDDGSNYVRLAVGTNEGFSSGNRGNDGGYQAPPSQLEMYGDGSNYVRVAPHANEGFSSENYQAPAVQSESYNNGPNYVRVAPDTNEGFSSENRGNDGGYQAPPSQLEMYGDGSNYVRVAPHANEGFSSENYQAPAVQSESYNNGSNYVRVAPDTNEGFSSENYQAPAVQLESYVHGSNHVPDTNEGFSLQSRGNDGGLPALPESYGDGCNYATHVPNTNEGFLLANNGYYQVPAAQPEMAYQEINLIAQLERCSARDSNNVIVPVTPNASRKRAADAYLPDDVQGGGGFKRHKADAEGSYDDLDHLLSCVDFDDMP